jgi:hypothetical protein
MPKKNPKTKSNPKTVTFDSDSDSGADYQEWPFNSPKSDKDSDEEDEPTKRMQAPKSALKSLKRHTMDPATSDAVPVPLVSIQDMQQRDLQVHLPARIFTISNTGYLVVLTKCAGMEVSNVNLVRDADDHTVVRASWPTFLADEPTLRQTYEDEIMIATGEKDLLLGINPQDTTLSQMATQLSDWNGPKRAEEIAPTTFQVLRFPSAIKASVSGFTMTAKDGEFFKCGLFANTLLCSLHFFLFLPRYN